MNEDDCADFSRVYWIFLMNLVLVILLPVKYVGSARVN